MTEDRSASHDVTAHLHDVLDLARRALAADVLVVDDGGPLPEHDPTLGWLLRAGRRLDGAGVCLIGDLARDTRFGDHPSVTGSLPLRFAAVVHLGAGAAPEVSGRHRAGASGGSGGSDGPSGGAPVTRLVVGGVDPRRVDDELCALVERVARVVSTALDPPRPPRPSQGTRGDVAGGAG